MNDQQNLERESNTAVKNLFTSNVLLVVVIAACLFMGGFWWGQRSGVSTVPGIENTSVVNRGSGGRVDFSLFWKAWDVLSDRYVDRDDLIAQELLYGAIKGMFAATGDPYTTFFDPEVSKAFSEELDGSFEGIGAEIGIRDNLLTIIAPLDGSPAEKSGLRAGDHILQIDGEISADISVEDAVKKIRGDRGTTVVFSIFREGERDTREISVVRDTIVIESVTIEREGDVASIRVSQFGTDTVGNFRKILESVEDEGYKKIIIDLRNNPGGVLDGAIGMIGYFVPEKSIAVIERQSGGVQKVSRTNTKQVIADDVQIVVLINQGSASASEIFAAALKVHLPDRVTLIGEKSFGKGSVQELVPMKGRTTAKITVAKWLGPDESAIDGVGISPDVTVPYTNEDFDEDRDPQYDVANRLLAGEKRESLMEEFKEETILPEELQ